MQDGLETEEIQLLFDECQGKLCEVEDDLLDLADSKTVVSPQLVSRMFRAVHHVTSAAGYLVHAPLKCLSHASEDVLAEVREGKIGLSAADANVLLSAVDRMKEMVAGSHSRQDVEFSGELESLNAILHPQGDPRPVARGPAGGSAGLLEASPGVPAAPPRSRRLRVLVAEDDFTSRVVLQGLLLKYGDCHIAVNGREAVEAFRGALQTGQGYDLICMDIWMPELDGTAAVRQIRAIEEGKNILSSAGVKIFMTTGIRDIKAVVVSFEALCDAYLFKPIDGEKLEDHLRSFGLVGG